MFATFEKDRNYLENKYHRTDEPFDPFFRRAYHGYEYDPATGLDDDGIKAGLAAMEPELENLPHPVAKARAIEYVLDHTRIDVNEADYFIGIYTWNREIGDVTVKKWEAEMYRDKCPGIREKMTLFSKAGIAVIWPDFDHVVPNWDDLLSLGFPGILARARRIRAEKEKTAPLTADETAFFDGIEIEYSAILRLLERLWALAKAKKHAKAEKIAGCLRHLADGGATDTYEAMQLMFLYFMISENVDWFQTRSLGNGLDNTLRPFWHRDLESGRYTREELCEFLAYFLMQWSAIDNYWGQPFYLAGTNADGSSMVDDVTYDILTTYRDLGIYNPKIQIKVNRNTPEKYLNVALEMVRNACGNLVFCCEPGHWKAMMSYGATAEEARTYDVRGCYETGVRCNEVSTGTAYVNAPQALLLALRNGKEEKTGKRLGIEVGDVSSFRTFEDFYSAVIKEWSFMTETMMGIADRYEPYLDYVNPSSLYSALSESVLEKAVDGYARGMKYNNSAILNCGFASLVDSLMAVKYLVYDKKLVTLAGLRDALDANWQGYGELRRAALDCPHKYGNGDEETDLYAAALARWFAMKTNNRPNVRGGVYKAIMHSARQFLIQGERTGATPDGRLAGAELSKNASPVPGMDREGVTALITSALRLEPNLYQEAFCVDVMLHPSAVSGVDGIDAMRALVMAYLEGGGMSIQFNVFDTAMLRDAQAHPEKYRNLQVRVCGWNVRWNDLPRKEQEAFIERAERVR